MSKHLKDLRMYKCILVLRSAVRATFAGYASESLCFAGVGLSQVCDFTLDPCVMMARQCPGI